MRFSGAFTALVTPFVESAHGEAGEVDLPAFSALVEAQIESGISGLVPCGTTGEAPTLEEREQLAIIRRAAEMARGRVPVVAGTGSFSTAKSIAASKAALAAGADGVMIVVPYYSKPTQEGLYRHMTAIAAALGDAPVMLYNIPGRSVVDLSAETVERICVASPNIVAIKEASGNVLRCQELVRRLGDRLVVLCGDDALTVPMMACGARGVVSVTSNLLPREVSAVTSAMNEACGERPENAEQSAVDRPSAEGSASRSALAAARAAHLALLDVHAALFVESNPAPIKAALAAAGRMSPAVRPPLVPASERARGIVRDAVERYAATRAVREGSDVR